MSLQENSQSNNTKILKTENGENNNEQKNSLASKTFQGGSFIQKKENSNSLNPERRRLKRLEKSKEIIRSISKRLLRQDSLFITGFNGEVRTPFRKDNFNFRNPRIKLKSEVGELKKYNVFETEDDFIQKTMYKLYVHNKKKKQSEKMKKRKVLDKIYAFSPYHNQTMRKAKSKKYLPLKEYQENILLTFAKSCKTIEQGKLLDLVQEFKYLRMETESVVPLPKINITNIRNHVLKKGYKNLKKMTFKDYLLINKGPLDEFEKESLLINKLKKQKYISHTTINKRNKNLDILPEYVKDKFNNQFKYHG